MKSSSKFLNLVGLLFIGLALLSCKPEGNRADNLPTGGNISPQQTPASSVSVLPTPTIDTDVIQPTPAPPSPTLPPVPTPLPTPVVTPIPTAVPPIIPLPSGQTSKSYTLVFHDQDLIRAIDSDTRNGHILLNVHAQLPLFLADERSNIYVWGNPSPNGKQLALVSSNVETLESLPKGKVPEFNIYLLDLVAGRLRLLVQNGVEPVWSPDGTRIAYQSTQTSGLWIVDVVTGTAHEIYTVNQESEHFVTAIDWAPDSRHLVFSDAVFRQSYAIVVSDVDGAGPVITLVSSTTHWPKYPRWSPSGDKILFVSPAGKSSSSNAFHNLWVMNPDGSDQIQLTHEIDVYTPPRWSPDGHWIVFAGPIAYEEPKPLYELWLADRTGSTIKRLTSNAVEHVSESEPVWSPDGTQIIFVKDQSEVWTISLADGMQTKLPSATRNFIILPWTSIGAYNAK